VALLVASLVRFLVFVFPEVPFPGVIPGMRMVIPAIAHTLLVCFVLRIVLVLAPIVVVEWSPRSLRRAPTDTNAHCNHKNPDTVS
jgi:hypothetical protein